ncbi:MAG: N-6 DNA methylase, partial [Desulfobacterales bacterium]|nr:N-6 DNA methylase [Desulfobacterales bacterium]
MPFDQPTRNRLQKFVAEARALLSRDFTRQLQNDHGMDPETGEISDPEKLSRLDAARLETARLLRDTLDHHVVTSPSAGVRAALDRIVREQAFTVLNRLCALRMAEARGILIQSIGKGYQSKGFQLYFRLAGAGHGEIGDAYRGFLFSLFDEFAADLPTLFDRYSPMGRLFPRESALLALLDRINHPEIAPLWAEDEAIGWIYQYFNSAEERREMRAQSQAPRNSRELAVRNQFFTPRYVVEFLTDNTLGRLWWEMTRGKTALAEACRYRVRRPNEIFLARGETAPAPSAEARGQDALLNQPVHIPHRPLKDPREIRVIDPACGSMHFGLYAFDLFETIYSEAWDMARSGEIPAGAAKSFADFQRFASGFGAKETFLAEVPRLIIERNIHGVEIDARAAQIAGLSLWLRAQRAWKERSVPFRDRPRIRKSNIVRAEPMPGEKEMLKEFTEGLRPRVLGKLVEIIFEKMALAGEAGSLLKIEKDIKEALDKAREEFSRKLLERKFKVGKEQPLPGFGEFKNEETFDFTDLPGKTDFWKTAEQRILDALQEYASRVETADASRKRLFAEDAVRGFAFINLFSKRFDVVLMNPPFGSSTKKSYKWLKKNYPISFIDLLASFIARGVRLLHSNGKLGAITSRACLYTKTLESWRQKVAFPSMTLISDLGDSVLDNAVVRTCAVIYERKSSENGETIFFDLRDEKEKSEALLYQLSQIP